MRMRRAAIVSPLRTPVGKFGGALASLTAGALGAHILKALVERSGIDPACVDDVVFGHGYPSGEAPSIGRWAWLAAGLPQSVPGWSARSRAGLASATAASRWRAVGRDPLWTQLTNAHLVCR